MRVAVLDLAVRRAGGVLILTATLGGCAALHGAGTAPTAAVPQAAAAVEPEVPPPDQTAAGDAAGEAAGETRPAGPDAPAATNCVPAGKPRPKPRPKVKPVHKEAPPQAMPAPVVKAVPADTIVDAQVKAMDMSVMSILGKKVKGPAGDDLGRVVDVLADGTGRVRVAVIDFGGFLGVGNHRIAVDWPLLRFSPDGQEPSLLLSVSPDKLKTAPEYKDNPKPQILVPPSAAAPVTAPIPAAVDGKK